MSIRILQNLVLEYCLINKEYKGLDIKETEKSEVSLVSSLISSSLDLILIDLVRI